MFDFLRTHQLNIMIFLSGICAIQTLFVALSKALSKVRKLSMILMNVGAFILLLSDRYAYIYRGDTSELGYVMVRVCNFLVYFMTSFIVNAYNIYIIDLYTHEGGFTKIPFRLKLTKIFFFIAATMLIVSQFTHSYYYFDEQNRYTRGPLFIVCYLFPLLMAICQLSFTIQYRKRLSRLIYISLLLFSLVPFFATLAQIFTYGLSLTNITCVGLVIILYVFSLIDLNSKAEKVNKLEIEYYKDEQQKLELLFEQTAEALVNAIDAKDRYTQGHSSRVAEYSKKIAKETGKSEKECNDIYFSALLHDVGKIGIPDDIINKDGKLTAEEYEIVKTHSSLGSQILSGINQSPYLSVGANHHHERYDGTGYPDGLKGEEIPEVARIIAVADAYDAMTSKRSYRDPIPQQRVREEIVKGSGTQFDPVYARIMLHMIDLDTEFEMKEQDEIKEITGKESIDVVDYRSDISDGILVNDHNIKVKFKSRTFSAFSEPGCIPSIIIFDSLDAKTHETDNKKDDMLYYEYGEVWVDGKVSDEGTRNSEIIFEKKFDGALDDWLSANIKGIEFEIDAVKVNDHFQLKLISEYNTFTVTFALPDSSRYTYIAFTGRHCYIHDFVIERDEIAVVPGYIKRIAKLISYIDSPMGDIPNIQINGWRSACSKGIPLISSLTFTFHSMSLPTARLVWHCPAISLFSSWDGSVKGTDFREYAYIRMDGECWDEEERSENNIIVNKSDDFIDWNVWKSNQKDGVDCKITVTKQSDTEIIIRTENNGINTVNTTTLLEPVSNLYVSLTGDQCAITNIRIY